MYLYFKCTILIDNLPDYFGYLFIDVCFSNKKKSFIIIYALLIHYIDSDCGEPLLEKAVLKATSSLPDRGPENAVLNGNYTFIFQFFVCRINTYIYFN